MIDRPRPHVVRQRSIHGLVRWPVRTWHWLLDDDLVRAGIPNAIGRVRSRLITSWHTLRRRILPGQTPALDIRHALGVWRYPEDSRQFLAQLHRSLKAYRPEPYPGSMLVIRSRSGRLLSLAERPPDLGWRALVSGPVATETIPGAHDTIVMEPRVRHLAAALRRHLDA